MTRTDTTARKIRITQELEVEILERGSPSGLPVLLLHGVTDSCRAFEPMMRALPPSLRVVAPSMRGHGGSDAPESGFGPKDMAADVARLLDALEIDRAIVLGHSMGGSVALRFALQHPGRTLGLMLVGACARWRGNVEFDGLARDVEALRDPIDEGFVRAFQESTVARPVPAAFMDGAIRESLRVPARVWREAFRALAAEDVTAELGRIGVPVVLICGERDDLARAQQALLREGLRGSAMMLQAGAGHAPHWEDPSHAAGLLADFAASVVAGSSPARVTDLVAGGPAG